MWKQAGMAERPGAASTTIRAIHPCRPVKTHPSPGSGCIWQPSLADLPEPVTASIEGREACLDIGCDHRKHHDDGRCVASHARDLLARGFHRPVPFGFNEAAPADQRNRNAFYHLLPAQSASGGATPLTAA